MLVSAAQVAHSDGVQETMEYSRHWNGFVCPDCRFVFRVPRDHDGVGVVCPNCRRMLKIPSEDDQAPPLVLPSNETESPLVIPQPRDKRRRKKKERQLSDLSWDSAAGKRRRSGRPEKRHMLWMLIGGVALLAVILGGVVLTMSGHQETGRALVDSALLEPGSVPPVVPATPASDRLQSDAVVLTEAERVTRQFLNATTIEELLPLVRDAKMAEPRMRQYYGDRKITAPGMMEFNAELAFSRIGESFLLNVRTGNADEKCLAYVKTPQGIQIDWEHSVGWSDIPWQEFVASKPSAAHLFRVNLCLADYYNFAFSDERKWQSYQLISPDGAYAMYGYAERGSRVNAMLPQTAGGVVVPVMVAMKFPENATSPKQVIIEKFIADGWVMETQSNP